VKLLIYVGILSCDFETEILRKDFASLDNPPLFFRRRELKQKKKRKKTSLTRMGKLRSGLSSNIIIDTAVAAERIRNFKEKELESANVERIKRAQDPFPPSRYFHSVGYFRVKLTALLFIRHRPGFCRFAAIPDASDARPTDAAGCVSTLWMLSMRAIDANPMNLDFYVYTERARRERERERVTSAVHHIIHLFDHGMLQKLLLFKKRIPI
jgi:hypothetical protein